MTVRCMGCGSWSNNGALCSRCSKENIAHVCQYCKWWDCTGFVDGICMHPNDTDITNLNFAEIVRCGANFGCVNWTGGKV